MARAKLDVMIWSRSSSLLYSLLFFRLSLYHSERVIYNNICLAVAFDVWCSDKASVGWLIAIDSLISRPLPSSLSFAVHWLMNCGWYLSGRWTWYLTDGQCTWWLICLWTITTLADFLTIQDESGLVQRPTETDWLISVTTTVTIPDILANHHRMSQDCTWWLKDQLRLTDSVLLLP